MASVRPAEVFPPGEYLKEEMEARDWTQTDLAAILGRPLRLVNEIISGKRAITPETAVGLAGAFGTSPQFWMNLETACQLGRTAGTSPAVALRARLYGFAPIQEMLRRGWIQLADSVDGLERNVLEFFGIGSLDEEPMFVHAAKKSTPYTNVTPAQRAWLCRARQLAQSAPAARFTEASFRACIENLRRLLPSAAEIRRVPKILADGGIRFVVVEPLHQTKIDGACFWLNTQAPVIATSIRFDRIDNAWFVIGHELGHIRNRDGQEGEVPLDIDLIAALSDSERPANERLADGFAEEFLIPKAELDDFVARVKPLFSKPRITGFARTINVHPGLVVGQLQNRREITFSHSRETLVKIREILTASALTDGWGYSPPPTGSGT